MIARTLLWVALLAMGAATAAEPTHDPEAEARLRAAAASLLAAEPPSGAGGLALRGIQCTARSAHVTATGALVVYEPVCTAEDAGAQPWAEWAARADALLRLYAQRKTYTQPNPAP